MKERDSLREFDEIIENIDRLTGEDARAFLKLIHGYLSIVEEGDGTFTHSDFVEKVSGLYKKDVARVIQLREEIKNHLNPFIKVIEILLSWRRKCTFL
ncbi:hypothetical protein NGE73_09145 [Bacillus cereus]|uniref:Uncharacterized protein n=1 Tax=Bacillus anthracis TaxID=1392 RepID=A0A0J1KHE8_BACAN|nr:MULTISPECIES: hypothetical protein [Bacillus]EDX67235.1 conserved hypothetical protein [Bacillus cereus NVH0597-99]KLV15925.1 hypothetical protein ABW01_21990 [Bacillus anthracis]MCU4795759.1 hypothetical protein [Bacillus cereus]MDA2045533.1 hypothetical protein [Bacillus cereus]MDA2472724.1 hypothetical protein [Bacillus cereus]